MSLVTKCLLWTGISCSLALAPVSSAVAGEMPTQRVMPSSAPAPAFYVQALAGLSFPGTNNYFNPAPDGTGVFSYSGAVAGVVGIDTGLAGLSVEADGYYTSRDYTQVGGSPGTLTTATAMIDAKYTVDLNSTLSLYGAAGLGGIHLKDHSQGFDYTDGWGLGYLLKAGVVANVSQNISVVGEVRYANSFDKIEGTRPGLDSQQSSTGAALVGLQFGF